MGDRLGQRDSLPYTGLFDALLDEYRKRTGLDVKEREFWFLISNLSQASVKPRVLETPLFPAKVLPADLQRDLQDVYNPWWRGDRGKSFPRHRRFAFNVVRDELEGSGQAVVLLGPRQVGKTVLQLQTIDYLIKEKKVNPRRILRVQFDRMKSLCYLEEQVKEVVLWFQEKIYKGQFNEGYRKGEEAYIFLDEIQVVQGWSAEVKALIDSFDIKMFVTGSSSARIAQGRKDLTGRTRQLTLGTLGLPEIALIRGLPELPPFPLEDVASLGKWSTWEELNQHASHYQQQLTDTFALYAERGGFPKPHHKPTRKYSGVLEDLVSDIVKRAVELDPPYRAGKPLREGLVEAVFSIACKYTGQVVPTKSICGQLLHQYEERVSSAEINDCLKFLQDAFLLRLVSPLQTRIRRGNARRKMCVVDHSLREAVLKESVSLVMPGIQNPGMSDLAGRVVDGLIGSFLSSFSAMSSEMRLWHYPNRDKQREIDFVLSIGDRNIPVEVKYGQNIKHDDFAPLRSFVEKTTNNAPFGIMVTRNRSFSNRDEKVILIPLPSLLLLTQH